MLGVGAEKTQMDLGYKPDHNGHDLLKKKKKSQLH